MARDELITREDREVWERYRASWQPAGDMPRTGADGVEAGHIAAYIDDNLSEAERRAVERRLVENPALLEALIAAKAGLHGGPTHAPTTPQSVRAWATNAYRAELARRRRHVAAPARRSQRRPLQLRPALAAAAASLVLVIAAATGSYFLSHDEPQTVARNEAPAPDAKSSEPWDTRTNKIFADPENAYFDALERN